MFCSRWWRKVSTIFKLINWWSLPRYLKDFNDKWRKKNCLCNNDWETNLTRYHVENTARGYFQNIHKFRYRFSHAFIWIYDLQNPSPSLLWTKQAAFKCTEWKHFAKFSSKVNQAFFEAFNQFKMLNLHTMMNRIKLLTAK